MSIIRRAPAEEAQRSTVLSRSGEARESPSPRNGDADAKPAELNVKEVNMIKRIEWDEASSEQTFLFCLLTLYSTQKRLWQRYDEEWALFELDHLKHAAPIP